MKARSCSTSRYIALYCMATMPVRAACIYTLRTAKGCEYEGEVSGSSCAVPKAGQQLGVHWINPSEHPGYLSKR